MKTVTPLTWVLEGTGSVNVSCWHGTHREKKPDNIQLNDYDQGNHSCFLSMLHNNSHVQIAH